MDRFVWRKEMGERLRSLRQRANLSLRQMAKLMAKDKGGWIVLSRLENAKVKNPSIGLIADYLRVCRAGFKDIEDLLTNYTAQPVLQERGERSSVSANRVEPVKRPKFVRTEEQKARRRQRVYELKLLRPDVEERLYSVLKELGEPVARTSVCGALCQTGRRWFEIVWRTRSRPRSRERQLKKEMSREIPHFLKREWVERVRKEMELLAEEKLRARVTLPVEEVTVSPPARADDRFLQERMAARIRVQELRKRRLEMFADKIVAELRRENLPEQKMAMVKLSLLPEMMRICDESPDDRMERKRRIEEFSARWSTFPQISRVTEMFLDYYEQFRNGDGVSDSNPRPDERDGTR
ncbi:MAG: helix-turn-helix transcriptional regulator [candidate division WOR-3 bacterium]|jgi:transcriptional regulator with XRE-family HTH domain|nr:helix-turn-helix domain-containing protein [candidate division WOR-3 bacterium]MDH7518524.1 helix-turn-helix transcriptional regulator [bacterium]